MSIVKHKRRFNKYTTAFSILSVLLCVYSCKNGSSEPEQNKKLILSQFKKWELGKGSIFDLLDDQAIWKVSGNGPGVVAGTYFSKKEYMEKVVDPISAKLSKRLSPKLISIFAEKDQVVVQWEANSTALDGRPYHNAYVWYMTLKNDRITKVTAFLDTYALNDLMQRVHGTRTNKKLNYE